MAIGNEYNGNIIEGNNKISMFEKDNVHNLDIKIEPETMYTLFDEDVLGSEILARLNNKDDELNFNHIDYFADHLVLRTHVQNFSIFPLFFHPVVYNDIKENAELSKFWHKEEYRLRTLLKMHLASAKFEDAKQEDENKWCDQNEPRYKKRRTAVVKMLMNEYGMSRPDARKRVAQAIKDTETRILNLTEGPMFRAITEKIS